MSSRAFRRLHQDGDVIKLPAVQGKEEDEEDDIGAFSRPSLKEGKEINLFEVLQEDEIDEEEVEDDNECSHPTTSQPPNNTKSHTKKKRKKKKKQKISTPIHTDEGDEVDIAIKEVTEMLGGLHTKGPDDIASDNIQIVKSLLCVNRRFLNADNEMKKIFGSRVIKAERSERKDHRKRLHRQSIFVTPKDTWPAVEKLGISMQLVETSNNCQHFIIEHSPEYQQVQFSFLDAVNTYDPNAIGAVLHAHPFHVDSLIQLSEVCKMGDDSQMAAELIERAVYQFECCFHPLFNVTQDNCRITYTRTENRSLFLALFKHLNYVERKGCHQTAFELCKLILSFDPESDPLCILLMIDYHALRAYEYQFLIDFQKQWEAKKNLSQLPNFAFSVPLAKFLRFSEKSDDKDISRTVLMEDADKGIQEALIMFPMFLVAILDKCSATLSSVVMNHTIFARSEKCSNSLELLIKIYIERTHSLWKAPEVLEWLGSNALRVTQRVDNGDPLVQHCRTNRSKRYLGTPRNICRHVILSDLENTMSSLPQDVTSSPIMMYDPLPPENSTSGYTRPARTRTEEDDSQRLSSNPFLLFLQSMLPSFNTASAADGGQPQLLGMPQQAQFQPQEGQGGAGAVGGANTERVTLENAIQQLTVSLRGLLDQLRPIVNENDGNNTNSDED